MAHPRKTSKLQLFRNTRSSSGPSTIRSSFGLLPWACTAHNPTKGLPCTAHKATQGCHAQPTKVWACHAQPNPFLGCAWCSFSIPVASFFFVSSNIQYPKILQQYKIINTAVLNFFFFYSLQYFYKNKKCIYKLKKTAVKNTALK